MANFTRWTKSCWLCRFGSIIHIMKDNSCSEDGISLVELLATLVIAITLSSILAYMMAFEVRSWNTLVPGSQTRSDSAFVLEKVQSIFQNMANVSLDSSLSYTLPDSQVVSTGITGTDLAGDTVEISLVPTAYHDGKQAIAIQVTVTPAQDNGSGSTSEMSGIQNTIYSFSGTSFAGTTFNVHGASSDVNGQDTNGQPIDVNIEATSMNGSSSNVYRITQTFAAGGGGYGGGT